MKKIRMSGLGFALAVAVLSARAEQPDKFLTAVESTGKQWVDTGIPAKSGVRIVLTAGHYNAAPGGPICGARNDSTSARLSVFARTTGCSLYYGARRNAATYNASKKTYAQKDAYAGFLYRMDCTLASGQQVVTLDGTDYYICNDASTLAAAPLEGDVDIGTNLFVFAQSLIGSKPKAPAGSDYATAVLYALQIHTNNEQGVWTLARDFKPCLKDGVAGLYDAVEEKIYFSGSTTPLLPVHAWTGAGADDKFSTAANWDVPPVSGQRETILFDTTVAGPITAENDLEGLTVGRLETEGTGSLSLSGNEIALTGVPASNQSNMLFLPNPTNNAAHVIDTPLRFMEKGQILLGSDHTCKPSGQITVNGDWTFDESVAHFDLYGKCFDITVNGSMTGPGTHLDFDIGMNGNAHYPKFYGSVSFDEIVFNEATTPSYPGFYRTHGLRSSNATNYIYYAARGPFLMVDNVFDERTVLGWWMKGYQWTGVHHGIALGNGTVQTFDRIEIEKWELDKASSSRGGGSTNYIRCAWGQTGSTYATEGASASLVLKATANAKAYVCLRDDLSLTYDPQGGSCTQEFACCQQLTTGDIFVKGGTLLFSEDGSLPNVPNVYVSSGATLALDSSANPVMGGLNLIQMEASATCRVETATANAFAASRTCAWLDEGAVFDVAAGVTVKLARLFLDGAEVAAGTYAREADEGVTAADWVAGDGRVVVSGSVTSGSASVWLGGASGAWGEASNWSRGVPSDSALPAFAVRGDAEITLAATDVLPSTFDLSSAVGSVRCLADEGRAFASGTINVGKGCQLVLDGRTVVSGSTVVTVAGGEVLVPDGCELCITNTFTGSFEISGTPAQPGRLTVSNALLTVALATPTSPKCLLVSPGGLLEATDSTIRIVTTNKNKPILANGGEVRMKGASVWEYKLPPASQSGVQAVFSCGDIVLGGTTVLKANFETYVDANGKTNRNSGAGLTVSPSGASASVRLRFEDQASLEYRDGFTIGNESGTTSVVEFASSAVHGYDQTSTRQRVSIRGVVADRAGYGEMVVSDGYVPFDYRGLVVGGSSISMYGSAPGVPAGCEGVLHVTGGALCVDGRVNCVEGYVEGLVVGEGACSSPATTGRPYRGRAYISGGVVTNANGVVAVGGAWGEGLLEQTGGELLGRSSKGLWAVGFAGGEGTFNLLGGFAEDKSDFYLGGVFTNAFDGGLHLNSTKNNNWPSQNHAAVGTLTVTGGELCVGKALNVGFDGAGVINVVGGEGAISVGSLVLSNTTVAASGAQPGYQTSSAINFTTVDGVVSPIVVENVVTNTAGTAITVDLDEVSVENARRIRLITCSAWEGTEPQVTIRGVAADKVKTSFNPSRGLNVSFPHGLVLVVR